LGVPVAEGSAQVNPAYVAYNAANGDTAIASTKAGSVFVYLIAGPNQTAEEYNIETAVGPPPAFGPLVPGNVYVMAGTGTAGLIAEPGNNQFGDSTSAVATQNPIEPTSVAFDQNGNVLIAGKNPASGNTAIQVVAKTDGTFYGVAMTAGNLYTIGDVGLAGSPSYAINMGTVAAVANGMSVDATGNIVVGIGFGVDFVNESSGSLSLYGRTIPSHSAAVISGNTTGGTDCNAGPASDPANSLYFQFAAPTVDASDNVYYADNEFGGSAGGGCAWVEPAHTGTLLGMAVTAGNVYKLAGNGGTSATPDGTPGINANVNGTSEMTLDAAGNVVLAVQSGSDPAYGNSPAIQVLAESTGTFYGTAMTAGDIYTVAGGPTNKLATLSGPTSILNAGSGNLLFTDGLPTSANLDQLSVVSGPIVTSVSPNTGPLGGGTSVTITGTNFTGATAVHFGSTAATGVVVNSATSITATSPAGTGTVDVTVTTPTGTSVQGAADQFSYVGTPTVTAVSPTSGPAAGGTSVTITGTGFTGATAVHFGANAATGVVVNSPTSITATSPAGTGTVDVTVTTPGGTSATSTADHFSYVGTPTVTAVSPTSGPAAGGTSVTITGTNLTAATAVHFGANAATGVVVNSPTSITATSPAGSAGTVDVTVTTPGGSSATSSADQFTYIAAPTVTNVNPNGGLAAGGTSVTITGTGFTGATAVHFGANAATGVVVNSATSITATSPAGSAGTVDVTVTTPGGTSATSTADNYTYFAVPTVTNVAPSAGPLGGGTSVTITGTGFNGVTAVHFGANAATGVVVNSATSITAISPAGSAGTVEITVSTPGGTSAASSADHFTYTTGPTVTNVSPNAGPTAGGTSVTISGTALTGATAVHFGANAATGVAVNSDTSITAISPAGSTSTVDVTVTTPGGTSATSTADHFTYVAAPTVTAVSPTSGPVAGGTSVTITGTNLTAATAVQFGANAATGVVVNSATSITAISPAGSAGTVHVTVTTQGGTSATSGADQFSYFAVPTVSNVAPSAGPLAGGTSVTITGTGFNGATAVHFGANAATGVVVNSATSITAISPAGTGTVDVMVTTPGGTSATSSADQFSYDAAPTVTAVSPTSGPTPGGTSVTITGTNFTGATAVHFGTNAATGVVVNSATSITATSPAGNVGTIDVTVTTPGGASATSTADQFSYQIVPPTPPAGATQSNGAASNSPSGTATASLPGNTISASGTGIGAVTVSSYASNPTPGAVSGGTGVFYDVKLAPGTQWTSLTITVCTLGSGGQSISWWDGSAWVPFSNQSFDSGTGCVTATVTGSTSPTLAQLIGTPIAATGPLSGGYWSVASDGGIFSYGDAKFYGSTGAMHLNQPIVGMASTHDGKGYWLVAADGGIFSYGDAQFYGSAGALRLNKPIVGMAVTADGKGYWLIASDGGVFSYGDAAFHGSVGGLHLNAPMVGMAATADGGGYWMLASDGGVFTFGDAAFHGSAGGIHLNKPIVGMAPTHGGKGYWLVASDGGIFSYGDAVFYGSTGAIRLNKPVVGMAPTFSGKGYWLVASDGGIFNYGDAAFDGSAGSMLLNQPIDGMAAHPEGV
jgi:hypothetical protein